MTHQYRYYFDFVLIRCGRFVFVVMLAATLGLHWTLLQTIAWTTMLADNLQSCSFNDAMVRTFDGRHPCCICKVIAAGKKSEKKNEVTAQMQKLEFLPAKENPFLIAPSSFQLLPQGTSFAESISQKPPTPPPRGFLA